MSKFNQVVEKWELNIARGINRKHLNQVPQYLKAKPFKKNYRPRTKSSATVAKNAKATTKVNKFLSAAQAVDMAKKYNTNLPQKSDRKTKLGSTGITLSWKGPGRYHISKGL